MDFTREPIIETIITPREGFKLAIRSSKGIGQEEYFVEAIEIVSFGSALFFRSLERPKCFMVPVTDYEVLEVREARMVLKNVGLDSTIKIGGGRDAGHREPRPSKASQREVAEKGENEEATVVKSTNGTEARIDKKRERRRQSRRRRGGRDDRGAEETSGRVGTNGEDQTEQESFAPEHVDLPPPRHSEETRERPVAAILPPPMQLISETLDRYREDELFKGVFHTPKAEEASIDDIQEELQHVHRELLSEDLEVPESRPRRQRSHESRPLEEAPRHFADDEDDLPM